MKKGFEESGRSFHGAPRPKRHRAKAGTKQAVNVSVDAEVLAIAKTMRLNLSQTLEDALRRLTESERARHFYEKHKGSFDTHNAHIERRGTLTEAYHGRDGFDDPAA